MGIFPGAPWSHMSPSGTPKGENTHQNHSKHLPGTSELAVTGRVQGESGMCQSWGAGVPSLGRLHNPRGSVDHELIYSSIHRVTTVNCHYSPTRAQHYPGHNKNVFQH